MWAKRYDEQRKKEQHDMEAEFLMRRLLCTMVELKLCLSAEARFMKMATQALVAGGLKLG